jgi:hypothetical protein
VTDSAAAEKNKLSRRKKARAKRTLHKALVTVLSEVEHDPFLRSHLFLNRPDKDKLVVGKYIVTKVGDELYNVYKKNLTNLLYENLYSFDAAMAIAEALNADNEQRAKQIVEAEAEYAKHRNDMRIYKLRYTETLKTNPDDAWVYEDRYIISSYRARKALQEVKRFRIVRR